MSTSAGVSEPGGFRSSRLRGLHPGWFGGVMGTGILAISAYQNPGNIASLRTTGHDVGEVLAWVAIGLAVILFFAYAARWIAHADAALADLRHPVLGPLYGTLPGGLLVIAIIMSQIGPAILPVGSLESIIATLAVLGGAFSFIISVTFAYELFTGEIDAQAVNGGWSIPPVVNIIVPMALIPLLPHLAPSDGRIVLALAYAFFGMGLLLFILILTMLHDRLVLHPLPGAALAPSIWIILGPVGAGSLVLLNLAHASTPYLGPAAPAVGAVLMLGATMLWGFGLWALVSATLLLIRYLRQGPLPYGQGWWAFTFPIGAYTAATLGLARAWNTNWLEGTAGVLFVALALFWLIVAGRTLWAVFSGEAWQR